MRRSRRAIGYTLGGAILLTIPAPGPALAGVEVRVEWVRNYASGSTPEFAFAYAVKVDASGNVYVTGSSYAPNGLPDFATIKYGPSGETLWVQRYNGPADNWDSATELAVDASGNVYVAGASYGPDHFDYITIKYGPSGTREWLARYDGTASTEDVPTDLHVDASGTVHVTGYSLGSGTFYDYATVSYDDSGAERWVARYDGPGNTKDRAWALGVDGSGNVYVTGDSGEGSANRSDYVTIAYGPSGAQRWVARYTNAYDYATALAVDASGNVFVTGYSFGSGTFYDYATVRYGPEGRQRWVARYHGGNSDDLAYALALDPSGNVYVTGESAVAGSGSDYATIAYDTRGRRRWVARYNGPGNATDRAVALAVDGSGVYVTGESEGSGTMTDFATVSYGSLGGLRWVARHDGPGDAFDHATAIAVDGSGGVHVTGRSSRIGGSIYTTIKYVQMA